MTSREQAKAKIQIWKRDPLRFVRDELRVEPDAWQMDALNAFGDPSAQRISLQACAGPGKTAVLAWMGLNFLSCHGAIGEHPKGAAVSITADNLKDNLWPRRIKCLRVITRRRGLSPHAPGPRRRTGINRGARSQDCTRKKCSI